MTEGCRSPRGRRFLQPKAGIYILRRDYLKLLNAHLSPRCCEAVKSSTTIQGTNPCFPSTILKMHCTGSSA